MPMARKDCQALRVAKEKLAHLEILDHLERMVDPDPPDWRVFKGVRDPLEVLDLMVFLEL